MIITPFLRVVYPLKNPSTACLTYTKKITNKVSTFHNNTNKWTRRYPALMKPRSKPGVVTHEDHVIVLGGVIASNVYSDDIEVLNWTQPLH